MEDDNKKYFCSYLKREPGTLDVSAPLSSQPIVLSGFLFVIYSLFFIKTEHLTSWFILCYLHHFRLHWSQSLWPSKTLGELLDGSSNDWFDVEVDWPSWETDFCTRPCIRQVRAINFLTKYFLILYYFILARLKMGWIVKGRGLNMADVINISSNNVIYLCL